MVTNKIIVAVLLLAAAAAQSRAAVSPASCQAAAAQPAMQSAKAALDRNPSDLRTRFNLADAWSDAGCFNEAVQVLQSAQQQHPGSKELETRLRVAKSLVGEQTYFDNLDRADAEAKLKRDAFRCNTLADLDACSEAARMKPDDATLLIAQADALVRAKRPAEAIGRYRRAATLVPDQAELAAKISAAEAQLPPAELAGAAPAVQPPVKPAPLLRVARASAGDAPARQYSNAEPLALSH
jgi:tetratricopeptide (TPR) repeat protein